MKSIALTIDKAKVYEEVAQTTAYVGAKMADDTSYDAIRTIDEDESALERFWNESMSIATNLLSEFLEDKTEREGIHVFFLQISNLFDENLTLSLQNNLFSFFVTSIVSQWFTYANKQEAQTYDQQSAAFLENMLHTLSLRMRPRRPVYYDEEEEETEDNDNNNENSDGL